ncbi:DUF2163 domain-containing protein [Parvularcula sp. ZS-1/3]|uniref:DUF2163 domain-containing protein n=1 Tax=Parvularcula mediterranea TaxID=2732508 RepID=A0A7Y3RNQ9_9PROT|nr:DUF2163 domain-containing protein [Parvularcula mediterranea]
MKELPTPLATALSQQGAGTVLCLKIMLADGRIVGLTEHDTNLTFGGAVYLAQPGLSLAEFERTADLAPDSAVLETALSTNGLASGDLNRAALLNSRAEIIRVSWENPDHHELIAVGTIGEVERRGEALLLEFRGLAEQLAAPTGRLYQKSCDASLGDGRCKASLSSTSFEISGQITSASGVTLAIDALPANAATFAHGSAEFPDGTKYPIRTARQDGEGCVVTLWRAPSLDPASGSSVTLRAGCDKRFETCRDVFANHENFLGFPTIPGTDVLAVQKAASR